MNAKKNITSMMMNVSCLIFYHKNDMTNSSYKIFCLYKRLPDVLMDFDLYPNLEQPVTKNWFEHTSPFIKKQCYRIYNEIENSYYNFNDVVSFLIYRSLWDKDIKLNEVNDKNIELFKSKFTFKQLNEDRRIINEINKKAGFPHIREYFQVRENGESLIYRLCMEEVISLYFFVYYSNNRLTGFFERAKLKDRNVRYSKFVKTTEILNDRINVPTYKSTFPEKD